MADFAFCLNCRQITDRPSDVAQFVCQNCKKKLFTTECRNCDRRIYVPSLKRRWRCNRCDQNPAPRITSASKDTSATERKRHTLRNGVLIALGAIVGLSVLGAITNTNNAARMSDTSQVVDSSTGADVAAAASTTLATSPLPTAPPTTVGQASLAQRKAAALTSPATAPYITCARIATTYIHQTTEKDAYLLFAPGYWETERFTYRRVGDGDQIKSTILKGGRNIPYFCVVSEELPSDRADGYDCIGGYCLMVFDGGGYKYP